MSNDLLLVSILMTAYNREKYIAEAIESVLNSTYTNFELIVVDDCSQDTTISIAQNYASQDSRIRVYQNKSNLGDYANRNHASTFAMGSYIMYVDSDDKIYPFSIEYCLHEMLKDLAVDMGLYYPNEDLHGKDMIGSQSIPYHFFSKPFLTVGPGGTMLKRSFFEKVEKYPIKYGPANDMYFNLKAAVFGKIKFFSKDFLFYRIHEDQEKNNKFSYLYNNYSYMRDALAMLPLPLTGSEKKFLERKNKRRFAVNLVKYYYKTLNFSKTLEASRKAQFSLKDAMEGIFH